MGFLSKLFGQPSADVPRILNAVARNGGQGIVQVPYDVFASYLGAHGTPHAGLVGQYTLNLDGKRHKVVIDRGLSTGLKPGNTLVTVQASFDFAGSSDEQIATVLQEALSSLFIPSAGNAYKVARNVLGMAESEYIALSWGKGVDPKVNDLRSPLIAKFRATEHRNEDSKIDWDQLNAFVNDTLIAVEDPRRRLDISYVVVEQLVKKWQLVS